MIFFFCCFGFQDCSEAHSKTPHFFNCEQLLYFLCALDCGTIVSIKSTLKVLSCLGGLHFVILPVCLKSVSVCVCRLCLYLHSLTAFITDCIFYCFLGICVFNNCLSADMKICLFIFRKNNDMHCLHQIQ